MTKIREVSVQQINAALQSLENEIKDLQRLVTDKINSLSSKTTTTTTNTTITTSVGSTSTSSSNQNNSSESHTEYIQHEVSENAPGRG